MSKEVITKRLSTTDAKGARVFVYAARAKGYFNSLKNKIHFFLILLFLALPWIKIGGEQSLLLDIPNRRFNFFGLILWAHDAPLFFFVLAIVVFALALATTLWGRVWCGWACPQTVFIDGIFRRIDELIEGSYLKRIKSDRGPWDAQRVIKKLIKFTLYFLVTLIVTHSFLAYFVGTDNLMDMILSSPTNNWFSFSFIVLTTSALMFNFLWFREQFCIIMCPYGRFQSILMDEHSLAPFYDEKRGEPRKGLNKDKKDHADCVNCYKCVTVCPTGIDIRNGLQMECVACTACMDACDSIMSKLNKPKGLIRYNSEAGLENRKWYRPRVIVYGVSLLIALLSLTFFLQDRNPYSLSVLRQKGAPFKELKNETLNYTNFFKLYIKNQSKKTVTVHISLDQKYTTQNIQLITPLNPVVITAEDLFRAPIFIKFSKDYKFINNPQLALKFKIKSNNQYHIETVRFSLLSPIN